MITLATQSTPTQSSDTTPCHPLFKTPGPQDAMACFDAIDQAAYVVELFGYLDLGRDHNGGLSPEAQNGYFWLLAMVQNTLLYASSRLSALHREQLGNERQETRYLAVLLRSLSVLNDDDYESLLNTVATEIQLDRDEVDQFIRRAIKA